MSFFLDVILIAVFTSFIVLMFFLCVVLLAMKFQWSRDLIAYVINSLFPYRN